MHIKAYMKHHVGVVIKKNTYTNSVTMHFAVKK